MRNDYISQGTFDVANKPYLVYCNRLRYYLEDASLLQYREPYKHAEQGELLTSLLRLPVLPRAPRWNVKLAVGQKQSKSVHGWVLEFLQVGLNRAGNLMLPTIPYAIVPRDDPSAEASCAAIMGQVIDIIRRFEYHTLDVPTINSIIRVVGHTLFSKPHLVMQPGWAASQNRMMVAIRHTDPDTRTLASRQINLSPSGFEGVDIDDIPDVERLCRFATGNSRTEVPQRLIDGVMRTPSVFSTAQVSILGQNVLKLEKFLRYASHELTDMLASPETIDEMLKEMLHDLGAVLYKRKGIYGGNDLMCPDIDTANRCVRFRFGKTLQRDILGFNTKTQLAMVRTANGVLAAVPLDVGLSHFRGSKDPLNAALYLAEASDLVNAQVITHQAGNFSCGCDDQMCSEITHHCQSCLRERLCKKLGTFLQARVCKRCLRKLQSLDPTAAVRQIFDKSLKYNHTKECHAYGHDEKSAAEVKRLADMIDHFKDSFGENSYGDDYSTRQRDVNGITDIRVHRDPFLCSVDASEPYGGSHDKTLRVHTRDNVAITTSGFNYIKQRQLIAFLVELGLYDPSILHSMEEKRGFEHICDELYCVAAKTPFTKKARIHGKGVKDLPADQAEWRSGKPIDEEGPWNPTLWRWAINGVPEWYSGEWDDETIRRLKKLSDQIQRRFGVKLQTASDGAPWISEEGGSPCPADWSWRCWSIALGQRHTRMRIICNRHGISKLNLRVNLYIE